MAKEPFFVKAAREFGESVQDYLAKAKYNYVIIDGIKPLVWRTDPDCPVIFGDMDEVAHELREWGTPIKNISIITEEEYIKTYMGEDVWEKYTKPEPKGIMDTCNAHNPELVAKINDAWDKNKKDFELILKALYERDIDEITDSDAFHIAKWVGSWQWNEGCRNDDWTPYMDMALADMKEHWEDYAENYLMHIADDGDLEAIIAFLHYPYLPIYNQNK